VAAVQRHNLASSAWTTTTTRPLQVAKGSNNKICYISSHMLFIVKLYVVIIEPRVSAYCSHFQVLHNNVRLTARVFNPCCHNVKIKKVSSYTFTTSALDGVSGQRHAPAALYPRGKVPRYALYRRLGGPQSRSEHRGYRKNSLPLLGIEPGSPGRPVRSQTLHWLSYAGSCKVK
jgi:hypothetical protein